MKHETENIKQLGFPSVVTCPKFHASYFMPLHRMRNPISIKDLLGGAVHRAGIEKEVSLAQLLEAANEVLATLLPADRAHDARALSLRDGVLTVACLHSSAAHIVSANMNMIMDAVKRAAPRAEIRRVLARLDSHHINSGGMIQ